MRAEGRETERHREWEGNATQMLARRGQMQTEIEMKGGNYSKLKPAARRQTSRDRSGSS